MLGEFEKSRAVSKQAYIGFDRSIETFNLKEDVEKVLDDEELHFPIGTPFPSLNANSKKGPGRGDLAICVAPSNFGKTAWLTAVARHAAVVEGKNVLYISLETKTNQIVRRFLAGLVDIPQEEIKHHKGKIIDSVKNLHPNLIFKRYKSKNASVETIQQEIDDLKAEGFFPDLVCVDYLQLLKAPKGHKSNGDNDKVEIICEELRDLAGEEQILIHTAQQTNRGGFKTDKLVDEDNISKAIESFFIADWFITFTQHPNEAKDGICWCTLLKNRLGPKGIVIKAFYDPNKGVFEELELLDRATVDSIKSGTAEKAISSAEKFLENKRMKKSLV